MKLFVDLDGVLGDFDNHYIETIGPLPKRWREGVDFTSANNSQDVDWSKIDASEFFVTMPMMKDAPDL